ncbi:Fe-S cluster assembly protein SufD [Egbenema bharatensis]|uniref:Fe-S cluster assembly protein SufD n=1 Tax=Egbenema bharatensis TaxID=3463334 RepID=UPI003A85A96A
MTIQVSANPMTAELTPTMKRDAYLAHLLNLVKQTQPTQAWLTALRDRALAQVQSQSFPTTRDEEWRFTDLSPLLEVPFAGVGSSPAETLRERESGVGLGTLDRFVLPEAVNSRLVFVDRVYAPELSSIANLPDGLTVGALSGLPDLKLETYLGQQSGHDELFTALNTAGLTDAAIVWVPKNLAVETPIHLLFVSTAGETPLFNQPRCLVVAEPNSSVTIVEEYGAIGQGQSFTNAVTEIWVEGNAEVNHTRLQRESDPAFHVGKTAVSQARDSRYICHAISLGAAISRHHLEIYQTGEQIQTTLNGLTIARGTQLADTHSKIALTQPYATTNQLHKCIVDDRAHTVFNGKVFVPQAAQLTNAGQLNQNLLLSPKARVDTKPQLEIVADNVKCTHGATVGQLEADEVFYLQSRGIDADSARSLLIYAFAIEIINDIPIETLRDRLSECFR